VNDELNLRKKQIILLLILILGLVVWGVIYTLLFVL